MSSKWSLLLKTLPFLAVVVALKYGVHFLGWEVLTVSPLFSAIVSANIFLLGFLLAGVLSDYKESERLPGEVASGLEALTDEVVILYRNKRAPEAKACLEHIRLLAVSILDWFHKKQKNAAVMANLRELNQYFLAFEPLTQANFIVRMKQEQGALRRSITRIHTIRDTNFVSGGYAIAEATTALTHDGTDSIAWREIS